MSRCGCASCGCRYQAGPGISIAGTGSVENPVTIGLRTVLDTAACATIMGCVSSNLGNGLTMTAGKLSAKLSATSGNGLTFGSDGGLYAAGGGGTGTDAATVAALPTTTMIVGGSYGGGFSNWPEGLVESYRAGMNLQLPILHVPVRRTRDYFLIATHYRFQGFYNPLFGENSNALDMMQMHYVKALPGGDPPTLPKLGYFGCGWPVPLYGMPKLAEVFNIVNRRAVLYLEVKDTGTIANETPAPGDTFGVLRQMIRQFGLTKSVIVGAVPSGDATIPTSLANLRADGVETALHLLSKAQCDANPPATMAANGHTWVMISASILEAYPATVAAYIAAGLNVMTFTLTKQHQYFAAKAAGVRGVLAADPVYVGGEQSNFRHRQNNATWTWGTPDYGRHGYVGDIPSQSDKYRGYVNPGQANMLSLDPDVINPSGTVDFDESGYFILAGEQCPIRKTGDPANIVGSPNNYDITVGFLWDRLLTDRGRWMGVWFGAPDDRSIQQWTKSTQYTKGYCITLSQNGDFAFSRYDGVPFPAGGNPNVTPPFQFGDVWASGWSIQANVEYRIKISVRPTGNITISRQDGGASRTYTDTTWRGAYFHIGRHHFNIYDAAVCRWVRLETVVY